MNRVILFDLDGTLIDSTDAIVQSFGVAFEHFGSQKPMRQDIISHIGHPLEYMFKELGVEHNKIDEHVIRYKQNYQLISKEMTTLLPDALSAIKLASKHARLGVVTTKTGSYSRIILEHLGVMSYFETLIGREDVTNPKPHPEPILRAMSHFGDAEFWMIGDTTMDIDSANNAGINSVGVLCGYGTNDELEKVTNNISDNSLGAVKKIILINL
jgi:phosphoglycolate phosphatase